MLKLLRLLPPRMGLCLRRLLAVALLSGLLIGASTALCLNPLLPIGPFGVLGLHLAIPRAEANSLDDVRYLIRNFYPNSVSPSILDNREIQQMIKSLNDPYTEYMSTEDVQEFDDALNQNFSGVGIRIESHKSGAFIVGTLPNSPAREAGLMAGDIVVSVNKTAIKDWTISEIASIIRGTPGTQVTLGIQRAATSQVESITLTRANVTAPAVEWMMLPENTGYIAVTTFGDDTVKKFDEATAELKRQGAQRLILDLRGNSGGYFDGALELAERFVDGTITFVQSRGGRPIAQRGKSHPNLTMKTVVLTDSGSASASEILAAALKDNGFTLVGGRTFGKGVMQRVFNLSDGDYLKMTIAEFFSPSMKKIQGVGVEPTISALTPLAQEIRGFRYLNPGSITSLRLKVGDIHGRCNQLPDRSLRLTQEPFAGKGVFYLPARDTLEALGARVEVSKDLQTLVASYQGKVYAINGQKQTLSVNGQQGVERKSAIQLRDNICMISSDLLREIFPRVTMEQTADEIKLSW